MPPNVVLDITAEGSAAHLGKSAFQSDSWVNITTPPPRVQTGNLTFTAANGDILLASYEDGKAYHYFPDYVEVTFTGYFKDGGTGRFEHAAGYFTWEGVYNPITNEGFSIVNGEISYENTPL